MNLRAAGMLAAAFSPVAFGCAPAAPAPSSRAAAPAQTYDAGGDSGRAPILDTQAWATAEQSAFARDVRFRKRERSECLVDVGCAAPANVPSCPEALGASPVDSIASDIGRFVGKTVLLRGKLRTQASITLALCKSGCCNGAHGEIGLGSLPLVDERHPKAFRCGGDDSMLCCGFELPEDEVLLVARVATISGRVVLAEPAFCALRLDRQSPSEVSFDENGCTVHGERHRSGEVFGFGLLRCACYGSRVYCRSDGACFRAGQWFSAGAARPISNHCGGYCSCRGDWFCDVRPCDTWSVLFDTGKTVLHAQREQGIAKEFSFVGSGKYLELRGHADPGEGKQALTVARRRAEYVARIAEREGVARQRIEVRALGTVELGKLPDHARGSRSRVDVVVWQPELPALPEPNPP